VFSCEILWDKHDRSTGEALITYEAPRAAELSIAELNRCKNVL